MPVKMETGQIHRLLGEWGGHDGIHFTSESIKLGTSTASGGR
jgi:hypothetical protein